MQNFSELTTALDQAVQDHLGDDALYIPSMGDPPLMVRVMIDRPVDVEQFTGGGFSRARPVLSVSVMVAPRLREGCIFEVGPAGSPIETWSVASAPTRTGDGRWWKADVQPA